MPMRHSRPAGPANAVARDPRRRQQLPDRTLEEGAHGIRLRERNFAREPRTDLPDEIENHERDVVAVDVEADGKATVRIDDQFGRRLPPRTAQSACLEYQPVLAQPLGDVRDS